jgi:putative endonuclease
MYFVYIIQSQADSSYYVGYTRNLEKRLIYYNLGKSKYTKRKMPWKLVYKEFIETKKEVLKREKQLKNWKNRKAIERLISKLK